MPFLEPKDGSGHGREGTLGCQAGGVSVTGDSDLVGSIETRGGAVVVSQPVGRRVEVELNNSDF
jgi:formylmethanofuran dehydrogenase subunit C